MVRRRVLLSRLAGGLGKQRPASLVARRAQRAPIAEQTARGVLEVAVRIGEAALSLGAAATDVTDVIRDTCRAFGLECEVDLTFTSIHVMHDGGEEFPSVSVLRVVDTRAADYARLASVMELARSVREDQRNGRVDPTIGDLETRDAIRERVEGVHAELDVILSGPHRYRRATVTLLLAAMAAGVAVLLGGGPLVILLAAATTALIDVTVRWLASWGLPPFFLQIAGAAVATGVAVVLLTAIPSLPFELSTLPPSLVVASGIVVLLAGASLVGAADDAINGFPLTASGRLLEVLLLTLGLVVGIGGVFDMARRLGTDVVLADAYAAPWPLAVQAVGAAIASGAWAMASYAGPRAAAFVALLGGIAYLLFILITTVGLAPSVASAAAALVIGAVGEALGPRLRIPVIVTTVCGTVPLLPGLTIYRGMLDVTSGAELISGIQLLLQAGLIGIALAAGVTLGKILARRLRASVRTVRSVRLQAAAARAASDES